MAIKVKSKTVGLGCSLDPQRIDDDSWYYEYPSFIEIIHEVRDDDGTFVRTKHMRISRRKLAASLERMSRRP